MSPAPTSTALAAAAPAASGPGEGRPDGSSTQEVTARHNTHRRAARRRTAIRELVCASPQTTLNVRAAGVTDRKSTRLNSSHLVISYAVFCLKKKNLILPHQLRAFRY